VFRLNYDKIATLGLTPSQITNAIFASTNGLTSGTIKGKLDDYDIKIQIKEFEDNLSPYEVENLILNTPVGDIKLVDVASYEFQTAISNITRIDTKITVSVESDVADGEVASSIQPIFAEFAENYSYPTGVSFLAG
jgi:multidrug efflux pump subunit AcrB